MIRWGIALAALIYVVLLVLPDGEFDDVSSDAAQTGFSGFFSQVLAAAEDNSSTPRAPRPDVEQAASARSDRPDLGAVEEVDGTYRLQTADGEWLEIAAVINPFDLEPDGTSAEAIARVAVAPRALPEDATTAVPAALNTAAPEIWRVTGDRVNFRAGPSTNDAILTALTRGQQVEYLTDAGGDWALLRVVSSGLEGYMAVRFLEPVN